MFPIFVSKIFEKYIRQKSLHQAKNLLYYGKVLDESLVQDRFSKKIFDKFFTKEFLEETSAENLNRIINKSQN